MDTCIRPRALSMSAAAIFSLVSATSLAEGPSGASPSATPVTTSQTVETTTTTTAAPPTTSSAEAAPEADPSVLDSETSARLGGSTPVQSARRSSATSEPLLDTETTRMTWPNVPLLATGATVLAASYIPAIVGGAISDRGDNDLYIPVAGPWMTLAQGPSEKNSWKALLVADGAVQGVGALMFLTSFFIPEKVTQKWYLIGSNDVRVVPTGYAAGAGVSASGRF